MARTTPGGEIMVIGKQSEKLTKVPTQTESISFKITNLILGFNRQQSVNFNKRTLVRKAEGYISNTKQTVYNIKY